MQCALSQEQGSGSSSDAEQQRQQAAELAKDVFKGLRSVHIVMNTAQVVTTV